MSRPEDEVNLDEQFPDIAWDKPVAVTVPRVGQGFGCRRCIATYGFHGVDVNQLPQTLGEFSAHLAAFHGGSSG